MKYRILAVIVILIMLLGITVSATSYEYTLSPGEGFTSAQYGDNLTEISKKLNMPDNELSSHFSQNGLIYLAVSDDKKTQIKLSAFTDNFSSAAGDISNLDDQALTEFIKALDEGGEKHAQIVTNNNRKFVCIKSTLNDTGGVYTVSQYITICNNKTFYFAGYNEGNDTSEEITAAFKSFSLQEKPLETPDHTIPTIFIFAGIVVFSLLAIIMLLGIIKSYRKDKSTMVEAEENEN